MSNLNFFIRAKGRLTPIEPITREWIKSIGGTPLPGTHNGVRAPTYKVSVSASQLPDFRIKIKENNCILMHPPAV